MNSIFPVLSLDRRLIRWEDHGLELTPVERRGTMWFKREDYYAPLGYGGINGAKVRQIVWLVQRYLEQQPKKPGLLLAGSVRSPQLGRVSSVAKHFGLPALLVIGSQVRTAIKHENVKIAVNMGAAFSTTRVAYNPALQRAARDLHARPEYSDYYLLEYGLSVEGSPERVEGFYRFCSEQVRSIPDDCETIFMPAGSCNSTIALLYGIARFRPPSLKRVILFGIGPTRIDWYEDRLRQLERTSGTPIASLFSRRYLHHPELATKYGEESGGPLKYDLLHYDLHASKYASYQDEMPASYEGIDLHPTYEGKMLTYMRERPDHFADLVEGGKALFWIVGGEPRWDAMAPNVVRM